MISWDSFDANLELLKIYDTLISQDMKKLMQANAVSKYSIDKANLDKCILILAAKKQQIAK